jgi:error-prone DNA polymerase
MSITMIGLDTAKSVFHVHAVNEAGKAEVRRKLRRGEVVPFFAAQPACTVVLEACGAAHHWARVLTGLGHEVKLIAPEAVRPFVKRGMKNDAADAAALREAARRPEMRFVPAKSAEQQATLALHAARSLLVKQRTMLANAIRGLATEFGLTAPQGMDKLAQLMALAEADAAVPAGAQQAIRGLLEQCRVLSGSVEALEAEIVAHARRDETARRLATIPGIGPVTASLIAATVADIARSRARGASRRGWAWCRASTPPAARPAWVASRRRATGRYAGRWCWAPPRWSTGPACGTARPEPGSGASWSAGPSGWRPWRWRTRWRASPGR